jgi:hypothetical protein
MRKYSPPEIRELGTVSRLTLAVGSTHVGAAIKANNSTADLFSTFDPGVMPGQPCTIGGFPVC